MININDKQLKSLIKTVECGSFAKAEEELFLSRQALKKQIDSLEDELGFPLLTRSHQGIMLTPAGEEFYRYAKEMLNDTDATVQRCKEIAFSEQIIRIGVPHHPKLLLENVFAEFYGRFPNIKQQIVLMPFSRTTDALLEGRIDVAECIYRPFMNEVGIQHLKLFPLPYKCLVAPSHPLAKKDIVSIDELAGNLIYMNKSDSTLLAEVNEVHRGITFEATENDLQKISNICYNGGVFVSKAYFLDSMQPLVTVELKTKEVPMAAVIYRKSPSKNVKEFLNVIRQMYPQT